MILLFLICFDISSRRSLLHSGCGISFSVLNLTGLPSLFLIIPAAGMITLATISPCYIRLQCYNTIYMRENIANLECAILRLLNYFLVILSVTYHSFSSIFVNMLSKHNGIYSVNFIVFILHKAENIYNCWFSWNRYVGTVHWFDGNVLRS